MQTCRWCWWTPSTQMRTLRRSCRSTHITASRYTPSTRAGTHPHTHTHTQVHTSLCRPVRNMNFKDFTEYKSQFFIIRNMQWLIFLSDFNNNINAKHTNHAKRTHLGLCRMSEVCEHKCACIAHLTNVGSFNFALNTFL